MNSEQASPPAPGLVWYGNTAREPTSQQGTARQSEARDWESPLTLKEAADYLNVSERYMRRLVAERRIAYHKLGRLLRFRLADLEELLQAGRVEPPLEHPLLHRQRV